MDCDCDCSGESVAMESSGATVAFMLSDDSFSCELSVKDTSSSASFIIMITDGVTLFQLFTLL